MFSIWGWNNFTHVNIYLYTPINPSELIDVKKLTFTFINSPLLTMSPNVLIIHIQIHIK